MEDTRAMFHENRTIMEAARAMIHDQYIPMLLWEEASRKAVYVENRTPHRVLENKTPEEVFSSKKPVEFSYA